MNHRLKPFFRHLVLLFAGIIILYPAIFALMSAFLRPEEADLYPPRLWPSSLYLENFKAVLNSLPVGSFIMNSFIVSIIVLVGQLITSSLAAYAFAFLHFPGKRLLSSLLLATMMIPWEVTMIPNYLTIKGLGLTDSYTGLTLPFLAAAFGTFMLHQAFLQLPRDLFEAAKVDGCGHIYIFARMVIPLSRPILASLGIYVFLNTWNTYLWPLLITNKPSTRTVQIGIAMLQVEETTSWNLILAGVSIAIMPSLILLAFGLKQLVQGITAGAVKG